MKYKIWVNIVILCILSWVTQAQTPVNVILDTDIDSDVDDVGALAMLHTLADQRLVNILGVIVTSDDSYAPLCVDAINHYFDRPEIPIGVEKGITLRHHSRYTKEISEEFPRDLDSYDQAEDATILYRRLLSSQPDSSVVIISIGYLTNMRNLLESRPDKFSSLSGMDLIKKKVKLWSCMGGRFPKGKEANFYRPDPESTQICVDTWPTKIIFSGWEVGNDVITGGEALRKSLSVSNPVWRAYELYNNFQGRQSWDQIAVLVAIPQFIDYWILKSDGYCRVFPDGSNEWVIGHSSNQSYVVAKSPYENIAGKIEGLMTANVGSQGRQTRKPNIVFIMADDLGYSDVNCFNGLGKADYYETPNIDELAKQGMKFTSAYTNGPNCAPTRAALMSGQYYPRQPVYTVSTGARGKEENRKLIPLENGNGIPSSIYTMAEALRDAGYVAGHFGKWHLGPVSPSEQGFSPSSVVEVGRGENRLSQNNKLNSKGDFIAHELNKLALRFIEENKEKPFFLNLSHYMVHSPFHAPDSLIQKYLKKRPVMGHYHATYAAMVESIDRSVGRVMAKLDELQLAKNTIFVFYSDNGGLGGYIDQGMEGLPRLNSLDDVFGGTVEITHNAPLRGGKGQLYEGGIRVPLIIRWPSVIEPGAETREPVISMDFYPTFLEIVDGKVPESHVLDGVSILPILKNKEATLNRNALFWHFPGYLQTRKEGSWRTTPVGVVRSGDWKLLQFFESEHLELYNVAEDIGEQNNLSTLNSHKTAELLKMLGEWRETMNASIPVRKR